MKIIYFYLNYMLCISIDFTCFDYQSSKLVLILWSGLKIMLWKMIKKAVLQIFSVLVETHLIKKIFKTPDHILQILHQLPSMSLSFYALEIWKNGKIFFVQNGFRYYPVKASVFSIVSVSFIRVFFSSFAFH